MKSTAVWTYLSNIRLHDMATTTHEYSKGLPNNRFKKASGRLSGVVNSKYQGRDENASIPSHTKFDSLYLHFESGALGVTFGVRTEVLFYVTPPASHSSH